MTGIKILTLIKTQNISKYLKSFTPNWKMIGHNWFEHISPPFSTRLYRPCQITAPVQIWDCYLCVDISVNLCSDKNNMSILNLHLARGETNLVSYEIRIRNETNLFVSFRFVREIWFVVLRISFRFVSFFTNLVSFRFLRISFRFLRISSRFYESRFVFHESRFVSSRSYESLQIFTNL